MAAVTPERDESQMITAIVAGDSGLFHELIRPYERRVYLMALSFLKNEADAEDAAQEAFLKAFRNLSSFRGDAKFGTWLVSIALNEARSRIRHRNTIKMESLDEPPDAEGHVSPALLRDWREIPSEALERKEVRQMLQAAVTSLPSIYREVFQLRDIEQLNVNEAAANFGYQHRGGEGSPSPGTNDAAEDPGAAVEAVSSQTEVVGMVLECKHVLGLHLRVPRRELAAGCAGTGAETSGALRDLLRDSGFDAQHPDPDRGRTGV